jgi:hypothetical protein
MGTHMRAGMITAALGQSGRYLRYVALTAALLVVNAWLWLRFYDSTTGGAPIAASEMALAVTAGAVALAAIVSLWRRPMTSHITLLTTPALLQTLATHQAGHLVAGYMSDGECLSAASLSDPCRPRHSATPSVTNSSLRTELVIAYAGMAAEEIFTGESGSHTADDIERATGIAADMVGRFGMSGSLVSLSASSRRRRQFIRRVLDDTRARKELELLLRDAKREAMRLMLENRHIIITLRDALLRHRQITQDRLRELIENAEAMRHADDSVLVDLRSASNRPLIGAG